MGTQNTPQTVNNDAQAKSTDTGKSAKVKTNENGKPVLNKNTINQAQKPSTAPVTIPSAPGTLPGMKAMEELEELQAKLEAKIKECFNLQQSVDRIATERDRMFDACKRAEGILRKQGIGFKTPNRTDLSVAAE